MCEQCQKKKLPPGLVNKRRLKLWETNPNFHCAILGTCLSMDDLRKILRQSGVTLEGQYTDYELHATLVMQGEEKGRAAKNMQKMLDRKYSRWIQLLSRCKQNSELEEYWRSAMETGDIAGMFWAIMTHPVASADVVKRAYEDVHMLSHLQGASNRADLKRLKQLEQEHKTLQETLSKTRQTHHQQIARRDEVIRKQEQELLSAMSRSAQLPAGDDESEVSELRKQNQMLAKRLDWTESQLADRDVRVDEMREEIAGLKELLAEACMENDAMVEAMEGLLGEKDKGTSESPMQIDLSGKRILYVGGRSTLAPHLRSLVEAHNGRFEHHDGGLEDSRYGLQFSLAGADMVFCPID
ncbi:MAG: DUF2325 domain-containing protein, partial [Chromatiales bacterium]|nr:DUF2325 domain-containing protein [Chromatiales bacterium]